MSTAGERLYPADEGEVQASDDIEYARRYAVADVYLDEKAPEFYGTKVLSATPTSRLRIIRKGLTLIPDLDPLTQAWINTFESDAKFLRLGDIALHGTILVPMRKPGTHSKVKTTDKDWELNRIEAIKAYRNPIVRDSVLLSLTHKADPVTHVIQRLERWRLSQTREIAESEKGGSERAFEQALFAIHGKILPQYIEAFINAKYKDLDLA